VVEVLEQLTSMSGFAASKSAISGLERGERRGIEVGVIGQRALLRERRRP
jgi:hypothetical protein